MLASPLHGAIFCAKHSVNNLSENFVLTLKNVRLAHAQQVANLLHVLRYNQSAVVEVSLLFLGLLCQDVAVISVMTLYLASTGQHESLLCTGISLYFRHFFVLFINY